MGPGGCCSTRGRQQHIWRGGGADAAGRSGGAGVGAWRGLESGREERQLKCNTSDPCLYSSSPTLVCLFFSLLSPSISSPALISHEPPSPSPRRLQHTLQTCPTTRSRQELQRSLCRCSRLTRRTRASSSPPLSPPPPPPAQAFRIPNKVSSILTFAFTRRPAHPTHLPCLRPACPPSDAVR